MFGAGTQAWQSSKGMVLVAWCSRAAGKNEQQQSINSAVVQWTGMQPQWCNSEVQTNGARTRGGCESWSSSDEVQQVIHDVVEQWDECMSETHVAR